MVLGNLGNVLGMMMILLVLGAALVKLKIMTDSGKKCLTDLLINVVLPCNTIHAFCVAIDASIFGKLASLLITALLIQVFCVILTRTLYNRMEPEQRKIFQYATVCSNAGFIGYPVCEGLWGAQGVLYACVYLIPQRFVMWSAGLSYFTTGSTRREIAKKVLTNPCVVAVFIGLPLMVFQIQLPAVVSSVIEKLSSCTTALSLLIVGSILAGVRFRSLFDLKNLLFSLVRLVLIPAVVWGGCLLCRLDPLVTGVCTLLAGMPAGNTTTILAYKYHGDAVFASKCVVTTTLLSLLTIPVWCMLLL